MNYKLLEKQIPSLTYSLACCVHVVLHNGWSAGPDGDLADLSTRGHVRGERASRSAHILFSFFFLQCRLCKTHYEDQTQAGIQQTTTHGARRAAEPSEATQNIKAPLSLCSINHGSPAAPSDGRTRRSLEADLAPQSHTTGVTFLTTG